MTTDRDTIIRMDRDTIIRMAREAGFDNVNGKAYTWAGQHNITNELERFATLVAAAEREACIAECRYGRRRAEIEQAIRARGEKT